jgi:hypothetical protein
VLEKKGGHVLSRNCLLKHAIIGKLKDMEREDEEDDVKYRVILLHYPIISRYTVKVTDSVAE